MSGWSNVKNILCIRPDNMGDLVMSGPALRALKEGLGAKITVLTSSMATAVARFMPEIDDVITFDLPWVKTERSEDPEALTKLITLLQKRNFDAAIIFTVYSQNPLPSAMIAYQADIPKVLAYCRENPYGLITDWVPDEEPYHYIRHQVERDLKLVEQVCKPDTNQRLYLDVNETFWPKITQTLIGTGLDLNQPWLILHAGVSEIKRQFPEKLWTETGRQLTGKGYQILLTGSSSENELTKRLQKEIGNNAFDAAGFFSIVELITLLHHAPLLLSVNTGTVHLAAAVGTPVVVLYAQTNPQHKPWIVPNAVIEFPVPQELKSKNGIIRFVDNTVYKVPAQMPHSKMIVDAVERLIRLPAGSNPQSPGTLHESQAF